MKYYTINKAMSYGPEGTICSIQPIYNSDDSLWHRVTIDGQTRYHTMSFIKAYLKPIPVYIPVLWLKLKMTL